MICTAELKRQPARLKVIDPANIGRAIDAILAAEPPVGGWGKVRIVQKRYQPKLEIVFTTRDAALHLKTLLGFGGARPHFTNGQDEGSVLTIGRDKLDDLILATTPSKHEACRVISRTAPPVNQPELEACGMAIDKAKAHTVRAIIEIGRQLKIAHDLLANNQNGTFEKWVTERCGFTPRTARNYLSVWEAFGDSKPERLSAFTAESLYHLAKDSTPEEAVAEAMKLASKGESINLKRAKEIVGEFTLEEKPAQSNKIGSVTAIERLYSAIEAILSKLPAELHKHVAKQLHMYADRIDEGDFLLPDAPLTVFGEEVAR
jgi:Protein of unknown function (DUF3102)